MLGVGAEKDARGICEQVRDAGVALIVVTATSKEDVYMQPKALAFCFKALRHLKTGVLAFVGCPEKALKEAIGRALRRKGTSGGLLSLDHCILQAGFVDYSGRWWQSSLI